MAMHAAQCQRTYHIAHTGSAPRHLQILASFCDIATNSDPSETIFRQVIISRIHISSSMIVRDLPHACEYGLIES